MNTVSISKITEHYQDKNLGKLYFPNGKCLVNKQYVDFNIDLIDLYELLTDWSINDDWSNVTSKVDIDDIIAVIAFGSAVKYPGYTIEETKEKKYLFFGPDVITKYRVNLEPKDADFLVITKTRMIDFRKLDPVVSKWANDYDCGTDIKKAGIHLVNRSWDQFLNGINDGTDTVSISGLKEGILLFGGSDLFESNKLKFDSPHTIKWTIESYLVNGYIK
jgi:hypothetical protein